MKWITASDLEAWSDTLAARDTLPALVADLIRASSSDIDSFRFPSGDKAQVRGFDGSLAAKAALPFVPGGSSVWEFGVNKGAASKAAREYDNRTAQIAAADRANMTFVFVSPRTWDNPSEKLDDWIRTKKELKD